MSGQNALLAHLKTGLTTVCRAWSVTRRDGVTLGFTDHDQDLTFQGVVFTADSGFTPRALEQTNGLSVDNSEVFGALSSAFIRGEDIDRGLYDRAEVVQWLVNWQDPHARMILFRGHIGQIVRKGSSFQAELRGQMDRLDHSMGRIFQKPCTAVLGDTACRVDTSVELYQGQGAVVEIAHGRELRIETLTAYPDRWFERGVLTFLDGEASGVEFQVKRDEAHGKDRHVTLSLSLPGKVAVGDRVHLVAGCDRRLETCRAKFSNIANFRGFPDLPGEDWMMRFPASGQILDGGSLR